ncbi:MAG: serine hydrolase domain-containing protein [Pseudomonadota bacterium]
MKTMKVLAASVAALAMTANAFGQAAPAPAPMSAAALLPETQAVLEGYVTSGKLPGIVAAIGVGDFPTGFLSAGKISDEANAPAAGPDTLWRVYSMTKPVTAMAAMILIEEGKLGLDEPISKYLPAFAKMRVLTSPATSLDSVPAKTAITIRHLLTHTAGLGYNIINPTQPLAKEYERLGLLPGATNADTEVKARTIRPATLAAFADKLATAPLIAEPGTKWSYSVGLDLMGAVIEQASGMSFDAFLKARLFDPLKMTSTYFTVPAGDAARLSTNYVFVAGKRVPFDPGATSLWLTPPSFPYGGAGLVSSARDYDRFLHMLQNGGSLDGVQVMKPATVALAMSNLLPAGVVFGGIGGVTGGTSTPNQGFGAGGSVYLVDMPNGPGKGTYGWGGAAGTVAYVDPTRKLRGTIMVQYFPADQYSIRTEVPAALAKDLARFR